MDISKQIDEYNEYAGQLAIFGDEPDYQIYKSDDEIKGSVHLKRVVYEGEEDFVDPSLFVDGEPSDFEDEGGEFVVPDGITIIDQGAFNSVYAGIVTIPASVRVIHSHALNTYSRINFVKGGSETLIIESFAISFNMKGESFYEFPDRLSRMGCVEIVSDRDLYLKFGKELTQLDSSILNNCTTLDLRKSTNQIFLTGIESIKNPCKCKRIMLSKESFREMDYIISRLKEHPEIEIVVE